MERRAYAAEALEIIDFALVSSATTDLLFQRAAAAELAADHDVFVESAAALANLVDQRFMDPSPIGGRAENAALQSRRLQALKGLLGTAPDTPRVRQVRQALDGTLHGLSAAAAAKRAR
jgi:hypothetical protein